LQKRPLGGVSPPTIHEDGPAGGPPAAMPWSGGGAHAHRPAAPMGSPQAGLGGARSGPVAKGTIMDSEDEKATRLMGLLVIVASREDEEQTYIRLQKGVNWIGRFGSRASLELRDRECSQQHAIVICTEKAARLVDLDSANGTFVNKERVEIAVLEEGDKITIGRTDIVYVPFPYLAEE
jgi:FHA domain